MNEDYGALGKILYRRKYKKALEALKDLLKRKKDKRHDDVYYAAKIAQSFPGVEPRILVSMLEEVKKDILPKAGAGQEGTDELVKSYIKDTPGQSLESFKKHCKK